MDREAWHAIVHGVAKSQTWLSDWTELIRLYVALGQFALIGPKGCNYNLISQQEEKEKDLKSVSLFFFFFQMMEEFKFFQRRMEEIIQEGRQGDNKL